MAEQADIDDPCDSVMLAKDELPSNSERELVSVRAWLSVLRLRDV